MGLLPYCKVSGARSTSRLPNIIVIPVWNVTPTVLSKKILRSSARLLLLQLVTQFLVDASSYLQETVFPIQKGVIIHIVKYL